MACGINSKLNLIVNTQKFIRDRYGDDKVRQVLEALPPDTRKVVESGLVTNWVPIEHITFYLAAVKQVVCGGRDDALRDLSREAAKATFSTLYKIFFKFGSPQWIMEKAAQAWRTFVDSGTVTVVENGPKHMVARLENFAYRNPDYCGPRVQGTFQAPLELSGCDIIRNEQTRCVLRGDPHCEYRIEWR